MVLNLILINADVPVVRLERFKLLSQGCQVLAIGILAAGIIAPIFNYSVKTAYWLRCCAGLSAGLFELLGLYVMGYIVPGAVEGDEA